MCAVPKRKCSQKGMNCYWQKQKVDPGPPLLLKKEEEEEQEHETLNHNKAVNLNKVVCQNIFSFYNG